jgi:hypothetical protein
MDPRAGLDEVVYWEYILGRPPLIGHFTDRATLAHLPNNYIKDVWYRNAEFYRFCQRATVLVLQYAHTLRQPLNVTFVFTGFCKPTPCTVPSHIRASSKSLGRSGGSVGRVFHLTVKWRFALPAKSTNLMHETGTGFNVIIENPSNTLRRRPGFQVHPISEI